MTSTLDLASGFRVLTDDESIRERVLQRLRFPRGEWFLDRASGVDYVAFLGLPGGDELAGVHLSNAAQSVEGVASAEVSNLVVSATGTISFDMELTTDSGASLVVSSTLGSAA